MVEWKNSRSILCIQHTPSIHIRWFVFCTHFQYLLPKIWIYIRNSYSFFFHRARFVVPTTHLHVRMLIAAMQARKTARISIALTPFDYYFLPESWTVLFRTHVAAVEAFQFSNIPLNHIRNSREEPISFFFTLLVSEKTTTCEYIA